MYCPFIVFNVPKKRACLHRLENPLGAGPGAINNSMKAMTFKGFVVETLGWAEKIELSNMNIDDDGWAVVKCEVDWDAVGQKRFDGSEQPFMRCSYYPNWPNDREPDEIWSEYPGSKITRLYLNGEPGDVELVDAMMLKIARDQMADLLWVALDGDWYDVRSGDRIPEKLHKLV